MITCADRLEAIAVPGLPLVGRGDDVPALVWRALVAAGLSVADGDVLVVTSKLLSRAEGRFVELPRVEPSARAIELAEQVGKDPCAVELILRESSARVVIPPAAAAVTIPPASTTTSAESIDVDPPAGPPPSTWRTTVVPAVAPLINRRPGVAAAPARQARRTAGAKDRQAGQRHGRLVLTTATPSVPPRSAAGSPSSATLRPRPSPAPLSKPCVPPH